MPATQTDLAPEPLSVPRWRMPALLTAGIVCRVAQYLSHRAYWEDESFIVINLKLKTAAQLMGQLADLSPPQAAPPAWLLFQRGMVVLFGANEFALRALSLATGIAGLLVMAKLARRLLSPIAAAFAVALFAFSPRLIWHAVEVKPYSGDAFFATLMLFTALGLNRSALARLIWTSVVAAIGVWWSYPVVFVYAGLSLALLPAILRDERRARNLAAYCASGAMVVASFAVIFFTVIRRQQHPDLDDYWARYLPDYAQPSSIPLWLLGRLASLGNGTVTYTGVLLMILAVIGIVALVRMRQRERALALGLPLLITIAAAFTKRYPLDGHRINTFLDPSIILAGAFGLQAILEGLRDPWRRRAAVAIPAVVLSVTVGLAAIALFQPRTRSNMRSAVQYVLAHRQQGDLIYTLNFHQTWVYWPESEMPPEGFLAKNTPPSGEFWVLASYHPRGDKADTKLHLKRVRSVADPIGEPYIVPGDGGAVYRFRIRPRTTQPAEEKKP